MNLFYITKNLKCKLVKMYVEDVFKIIEGLFRLFQEVWLNKTHYVIKIDALCNKPE